MNRADRNSRPSVTSIPTETRSSTASPSPAPNVPNRRPKANRRARATRMWWSRVAWLKVRPFSQSWNRRCSFCSIPLLSTERSGWCCTNGKRKAPRLPPYPRYFQQWLDDTDLPLSTLSRRLNSLFAFSLIGSSERFIHPPAPADVPVPSETSVPQHTCNTIKC
ncbi:hypothetical protein BKA56DRAFT_261695 [Ilyonectria sp. MPI-CAGE-AT-0026]|nr:hypothetical protein BKA56DRAFT_261695 [Ilyonectria sp. MPI-CAGE-AT-0026]